MKILAEKFASRAMAHVGPCINTTMIAVIVKLATLRDRWVNFLLKYGVIPFMRGGDFE